MQVDELPEQEFEIIEEPGTYRLGIRKVEDKDGPSAKYLSIECVVTEGEHKGVVIYDNVSLSPKALWKLKLFLEGIGEAKLDLPISKGADDAFIVDEQGCVDTIKEVSRGKEFEAILEVQEPDEAGLAKGWKRKNVIKDYKVCTDRPTWED